MEISNLDRKIERAIANNHYQLSLFCDRSATLPDRIGDITNLKMLSLSLNQLTSLPESIGNLSNLTHLYANRGRQHNDRYDETFSPSGRTLTSFRRFMGADLHGLITLPESIGNLSSLIHLDVADNQLITLPNSISKLSNLTYLNISNNQIASLPKNIGDLTKLQGLNLSFNKITCFPKSIGNLRELLHLNLACNQLVDLPESIGIFPKLTHLSLNYNHLASLPNCLGNLSSLTHLYLDCNSLTSLPENLVNLSNLTHLDLGIQLTISTGYDNPPIDLSILQNMPSLETVRFMDIDIPRRYWTKVSEWQAEWLLDENNAEIRQKLIERLGYDRICKELNAVTVDTWQEYTLLKIEGVEKIHDFNDEPIGVEPMMLLKMTCPSTSHIHILRVPPEMVSAEEAITWVNHGIHPDRFSVQT
jgi:leucine-rich repeat protein SHOC2